MKATIGGALDGIIRGLLVLLVVFSLSWVAINYRFSSNEQRKRESSAIADSTITETEGAEEEEQKGEDDNNEAREAMLDWEAVHAAAESGHLSKLRFLILERGLDVDAEDYYAMTLLQVAS